MRRFTIFAVAFLIIGILALGALLTLFHDPQDQAAGDWEREVDGAVRQLARDYTLPVAEAHPRTVICEHVRPGDGVPECAKYIEALSEYSENLVSIMHKLNDLAQNAPEGVSAEHREDARQMAHALTLLADADQLLVDAWAESDDTKWQEGWNRFEDAVTAAKDVYH